MKKKIEDLEEKSKCWQAKYEEDDGLSGYLSHELSKYQGECRELRFKVEKYEKEKAKKGDAGNVKGNDGENMKRVPKDTWNTSITKT